MAKKTNEVADVQGLATNENEFETLKNAWKELLERVCEDSVQCIENELDDGMLFDPSTVRQYADEAEAAQDLYYMIDGCEDMEGYEDIYFKKYLIVDQDATVPNITFEYSIAPGEGIPASDGNMEVLPGIPGATVGTATFASTDTTNTTVTTGDQVTLDAGDYTASQ